MTQQGANKNITIEDKQKWCTLLIYVQEYQTDPDFKLSLQSSVVTAGGSRVQAKPNSRNIDNNNNNKKKISWHVLCSVLSVHIDATT